MFLRLSVVPDSIRKSLALALGCSTGDRGANETPKQPVGGVVDVAVVGGLDVAVITRDRDLRDVAVIIVLVTRGGGTDQVAVQFISLFDHAGHMRELTIGTTTGKYAVVVGVLVG